MYRSFNFERLFMARRSFAGGSGLYSNGRSGRFSNECSIESHHVKSECGIRYLDGLRDPQLIFSHLGSRAIAVDIDGTAGATDNAIALKTATVSQTNPTTNPPYALFRTNGTAASPNVTGIGGSQDTISAFTNNDPTVLRFGDGNTGYC